MDIEQILDKIGDKLHNYLTIKLGSHQDAEDVLKEVFYRILKYRVNKLTRPDLGLARVQLTGTYQVHQSVNKIIKKDFLSISIGAAVLIALLLFLFLRRFNLLGLALIPLLGAVPLTLAFITLTAIEFSPALIGIVAIIIGIGIDDAIHLVYRRIQHPQKGISAILHEIAPVLTLTSISAAICFLTLMLSSSPLVYNTGAIVGFGVLACWFFTMFLLPSFLKIRSNQKTNSLREKR